MYAKIHMFQSKKIIVFLNSDRKSDKEVRDCCDESVSKPLGGRITLSSMTQPSLLNVTEGYSVLEAVSVKPHK